jgi:hypothetical protein
MKLVFITQTHMSYLNNLGLYPHLIHITLCAAVKMYLAISTFPPQPITPIVL